MAKEKRTLASTAKAVTGNAPLSHGVGRRKSSVARAWLRPGRGEVVVNGKSYKDYFDTDVARMSVMVPFQTCPTTNNVDVTVNVAGGGKSGQAGAVQLSIARALVSFDETLKPALKKASLLTVDARRKERKKPGQRGARRKFQFVKR